MDWLGLEKRVLVVAGVADRRSVGYQVGQRLQEVGARVLWVVHTEARRAELAPRLGTEDVFVCDVRDERQIEALAAGVGARVDRVHGLVHSIAFASYAGGPRPFHETPREDFLASVDVSAYSLIALSNALKHLFAPRASVVTISISTTRMAAENYGHMAPVKAALDSAVVFLAKSFSRLGEVRFNAVRAGLLKTNSSAGIPGYLKSWLFAEKATLRGRGLETGEVADAVLYLLSPRSSGINAQGLVVDAGMGANYFDGPIVDKVTELEGG